MSSYFANVAAAAGSWGAAATQEQCAYMQGSRGPAGYADVTQTYAQYGSGMQTYRYPGAYPALGNAPATTKAAFEHSPTNNSSSPATTTAYNTCHSYYPALTSPRGDMTVTHPQSAPVPSSAVPHAVSPVNSDFNSAKMNAYINPMTGMTPPPSVSAVPSNPLSATDALSQVYGSAVAPDGVMQPYTSKTQSPANYYQWVKAYPAGWCSVICVSCCLVEKGVCGSYFLA